MEDGPEEEPDGEGDPFGVSEVAGEGGDELHQEKKQRDTDAEGGDETHAEAPLDEPERGAGGQPTEAKRIYQQVQKENPASAVAQLAQEKLQALNKPATAQ